MPKATYKLNLFMYSSATRGGFKSEDTGEFLLLQNKYSKSLSWAENLDKLFTVLGGKLKFSAQDSNLIPIDLEFSREQYRQEFGFFWSYYYQSRREPGSN